LYTKQPITGSLSNYSIQETINLLIFYYEEKGTDWGYGWGTQ